MAMTDPLGDMLTRIRNATGRRKSLFQLRLRSFVHVCSMYFSRRVTFADIPKSLMTTARPRLILN